MAAMLVRLSVMILAVVTAVISCVSVQQIDGPTPPAVPSPPSALQDAAISQYAGGQRVIPEYGAATPQVMIATELVISAADNDLQDVRLAKAIVGAGAELILITPSPVIDPSGLQGVAFKDLRNKLGKDMSKVKLLAHNADSISPWLRDYAPESAKTTAAGTSDTRFIDFIVAPADYGHQHVLVQIAELSHKPRIGLPLLQVGGNFMINDSGHCLMTEKILTANNVDVASSSHQPPLTREQVVGYFQNYLGCTKVTLLPRLPHEDSGHIDVFAKFLGNDTILLHEMRDDTIGSLPAKENRLRAKQMQKFLSEQKKFLVGLGFKIVTVPMPAPFFTIAKSGEDQYEEIKIIRSYTNGLILGRTFIIPQYVMNLSSEGEVAWVDHDLLPGYEQEMGRAAEEAGLKPVYVNADKLIQLGGSIHAVAKGLPVRLL